MSLRPMTGTDLSACAAKFNRQVGFPGRAARGREDKSVPFGRPGLPRRSGIRRAVTVWIGAAGGTGRR